MFSCCVFSYFWLFRTYSFGVSNISILLKLKQIACSVSWIVPTTPLDVFCCVSNMFLEGCCEFVSFWCACVFWYVFVGFCAFFESCWKKQIIKTQTKKEQLRKIKVFSTSFSSCCYAFGDFPEVWLVFTLIFMFLLSSRWFLQRCYSFP